MTAPANQNAFVNRQAQRGLSLIELMISITIGLLILSAMTTLFVNQSKTRTEMDKSNRMIDNGRYALEVLSESLRLAGFYGEMDPSSIPLPVRANNIGNSPGGSCSTDPDDMSDAIRLHVQGYNAATVTTAIASPPCGLTSAPLKSGSDILVLRRASTATPLLQATALNDGTTYLQVSSCQYDTTLFGIGAAPAALTLGQRNITTPAPLNNCVSPGGVATIAAPFASLRPFKVETYFVSPDNNAGDGIPTLKRRELSSAGGAPAFVTTPLVEGVEYLQVEYGIDGDSDGDGVVDLTVFDGVADSYVQTCADVICWSNAVAVKLYLVTRNIEPTVGHNDSNKTYSLGQAGSYTPSGSDTQYKRHAYTQVVRLVNPASRRE